MTSKATHYLYQELQDHFAKDPTFFAFIQKSSLDGLWYWDLENPEHEWMSPEFWTTLGYDPSTQPHSPEAWQELIHPEDQKLALDNFKAHCENPDIPYDQHVRYRHADGSTVWIRCRGLALRNEAGQAIRMLGAHTNITALKTAEIALAEKDELWRLAMEGSGVGVWSWDLNTDQVVYSEEWQRMLKCQTVENNPSALISRIHPEDVAACQENLQSLSEGRQQTCLKQHRIRREDGSYLWVQTHAKVSQTDPQGKVQRIVGTQIDISHIKETEITQQALLKTLEERSLLLSTNNEMTRTGWWTVDLATEEVTWSEITREIHEVDENFVPRLEDGISFYKEGDSRDRIQSDVDTAITSGSTFKGEYQLVTAKGREIWVQSLGRAEYNAAGEVIRLLGCFQDITERKAQELSLQRMLKALRHKTLLLESSNQLTHTGWWTYNLINQQVEWSEMARKIYEVGADFQPNATSALRFYKQPETREQLQQAFKIAQENHSTVEHIYEIISATGTPKWVHLIGQVEFEAGQAVRLFGAIQDITAQKTAEQTLIDARQKAEAANEAKDNFLANMSHEMRTPLNGVIGFMELLLRTPLNEVQQSYLQAASYSARSLTTVINSILDFSKLEHGEIELQEEKVLLSAWIQQVADATLVRIHQKELEFLLNIDPDLPDYIWTDPLRLNQVVEHLLDNAIKFTEHGEIELSIRWVKEGAHTYLRIAVRDTGVGIDAQNLALIFESFSQVDISSTRKFGGLGLGLSVVQRLLKLMGCELCVESSSEDGSLFWFNLPVKSENLPQEAQNLGISSHLKRVLVIDDNANNRRILEDMLKLEQIAVDSAANGFSGLQKILENTYDFVIVDYHMPLMDGLEVIQKIRQEMQYSASKLPLLLLHSSTDQSRIKAACQQFQVNFEEMKPITLERLRYLLRQVQPFAIHLSPPSAAPPIIKPLNILVVDDNDVNLILAENLVKAVFPEARITTAMNGEEAVLAHQRLLPDLILMDVQMPVKNGYEATRTIRTYDTEVPIIALTAGTQTGERERCLDAGMNEYLSKPVMFEQFRHVLLQHASGREIKALAHVNKTLLHERVQKLQLNLAQVKQEVCHNLSQQIQHAQQALEQQDRETLNATAKRIRGSALYLYFERMAALAETLEQLKFKHFNAAPALLQAMQTELETLQSIELTLPSEQRS